MLSEGLTKIISTAASYAARIGSPSTDLVHILLAMVDESEIQRELRELGISYVDLREALLDHLDGRARLPAVEGQSGSGPAATAGRCVATPPRQRRRVARSALAVLQGPRGGGEARSHRSCHWTR